MSHRTTMQQIIREVQSDSGFDAYAATDINSSTYGQTGTIEDSKRLAMALLRKSIPSGLGYRYLVQGQIRNTIVDRFFDGVDPVQAPTLATPVVEAPAAPAPAAIPPGLPANTPEEEDEPEEPVIEEQDEPLPIPATGSSDPMEAQKQALLDALNGLGIAPTPPAPVVKPLDPAEIEKLVEPMISGAISAFADSTQAGFDQLSDVLKEIRDEASKSPVKRARVKRSITKRVGGNAGAIQSTLEKFCQPGDSTYPVQFAGGSGIGKTWEAERWAEQFERSVFIGGTAALKFDEIIGWTMPMIDSNGNHTVKWKDGLATSAFRCVALDENGDPNPGTLDNCMVIFDELNRLDLSIQGVLIPALNQVYHPVKRDMLCYRLVTGRLFEKGEPWALDIPSAEVLYVPVDKLAVVATSNEGADYNTAEGDFAQQSRFVKERVFYRRDEAAAIYSGVLQAHGYSDTVQRSKALCELSEALVELKNVQGVLENALSTRHITRAIIGAEGDWNECCKRLHRDIVNACAKLDANDQVDALSAKAADDVVTRKLNFRPSAPTTKLGVNH